MFVLYFIVVNKGYCTPAILVVTSHQEH